MEYFGERGDLEKGRPFLIKLLTKFRFMIILIIRV